MPNSEIIQWSDVVKPNGSKATRSDLIAHLTSMSELVEQLFAEQTLLEDKLTALEAEFTKPITFPDEPDMVLIEGGSFKMSHPSDSAARPARDVTLSSFYIGRYPITQAQWRAVMGSYPSEFEGDNLPVESINWHEALEFTFRLSKLTGKKYRLPTDAEWEYASKGGEFYEFPGSPHLDEVGWFKANSNGRTQPVGMKKPNKFGLYDMSGNVWNWCSDWHGTYSNDAVTNPIGAVTGTYRIIRGGGYTDARVDECRVLFRGSWTPTNRQGNVGFRVVREVI
jgi:formylglycine-generating enzyme required for sulfatase activity